MDRPRRKNGAAVDVKFAHWSAPHSCGNLNAVQVLAQPELGRDDYVLWPMAGPAKQGISYLCTPG